MAAYYNEIDAFAAEWLRALISKGIIPDGEVDTRSIVDVRPDDLRNFTQCHFFAGIAGWSYALRLAGWPDERPIWTGSCPCQPFSVAGKGRGTADERHLWPVFFNLIRECRPPVVMGEQVAGKAGYGWLDGVRTDLAGEGYTSRGVDIPACAVDAPHIRQRLYWIAVNIGDPDLAGLEGWEPAAERAGEQPVGPSGVADADRCGRAWRQEAQERSTQRRDVAERVGGDMADARHMCGGNGAESDGPKFSEATGFGNPCIDLDDASSSRLEGHRGHQCSAKSCSDGEVVFFGSARRGVYDNSGREIRDGSFWSDYEWRTGADGKARRVGRAQPGIRGVADGLSADLDGNGAGTIPLLAQGVKGRVGKLRGYGNAIVPQLAAEVIRAFMDVEGVDGGII